MPDLTIANAATLTGAGTASGDLFPLLDVSASAGSQGSKITRDELRIGMGITGGGTLATGGFTLTVPATGTAALLGTANVFTAAQTINAGTLTTAALTLSQTWNNAGVTCRGLEYAVTDTNSAADSTLFRLLGGAAGTAERLTIDKNGHVKFGNPSLFTHETNNGSYIVKYGGGERCRLTFAENAYNILVTAGSTGDYGLTIANSGLNAAYLSSDIRLNTTVGIFKIEANPRQASGAYTGAGHTLLLTGGLAQTTSTGAAGGMLELRGGAAGGSGNNNGGNISITGGAPTGSGTRGNVLVNNLPTSSAGLPTGAIWNDAGTLKIA